MRKSRGRATRTHPHVATRGGRGRNAAHPRLGLDEDRPGAAVKAVGPELVGLVTREARGVEPAGFLVGKV
jgi:hypothetical protein